MRSIAVASLLALPLACLSPAAPASASDADAVVAKRGAAEITLSEIDARLDEIPIDQRAGFMDSPERIEAVLSQMLLVEQLAAEALDAGLEDDPRLARQLALVRNRLLAQFQLEALRRDAGVGVDLDSLARERYAAERGKYTIPESRDLRHVLISTGGRGEDEAKTLAEAALKRLQAGESLADLATDISDDAATRAEGGLLRAVVAGQTDPAFDAALQALAKPGDRTPAPVRSQYGFHLIELVAITPKRQQTFDEVRAAIVAELQRTVIDTKVKAHTDRLNSAPLEADPDLVASLRTRYRPPATEPAAESAATAKSP